MKGTKFNPLELFESLSNKEQGRIEGLLNERLASRKKIIYQPLENWENIEQSIIQKLVSIKVKREENDAWLKNAKSQEAQVGKSVLCQREELAEKLYAQEQKQKKGLLEVEARLRNIEEMVKFEEKQFRLYEQDELLKILRPIFIKRQRQYWLTKLPQIRRIFKKKEADRTNRSREKIWRKYLDKQGVYSLFYIAHVDNLESILEYGILSHVRARALPHHDISMREVNKRRARCEEVYNCPIHSYVPLYFNSRNPMLYVRKDMQAKIVILSLDRDLLFHSRILVTDGNAACGRTKFMKLDGCRSINWAYVFANTWYDLDDGKRIRCAEALIPDQITTQHIQSINCNNPTLLNSINAMNPTSIPAQIQHKLFF